MATDVKLRLRTEGAAKTEQELQGVDASLAGVARTAGVVAAAGFASMAAGATGAAIAIDGLIKQAGNFKDMEEKTGAAAEGLASLAVSAGVGGAAMEEVSMFSVRLTKNLTGVDDESKAAGSAIKSLGLDLDALKKMDPADQMEAIAKALATFEDGQGKTAVMEALAKGASNLLPFMKELGTEGGRQVILTQQQIEAADAYADAQARATTMINLHAQAIATGMLPSVSQAMDALTGLAKSEDAVSVASGVMQGALTVGTVLFQTLAVVGSEVGLVLLGVGREIGAIGAQMAALARGDWSGFTAISDAVKADGERARAEVDKFQAKVMAIGAKGDVDPDGDREMRKLARQAAARKKLNFDGAIKGDKKGGKTEQQLDEEFRIKWGREQAIAAAEAMREAWKIEEEIEKDRAEAKAVADRASEESWQLRLQEVESIADANAVMRDGIALIGLDEKARRALTIARLDDAIAMKETTLAEQRGQDAQKSTIDLTEKEIKVLKERRALTVQQGQREDLQAAADFSQDLARDVQHDLADGIANALRDEKPLKAFAINLGNMVFRRVTDALADAAATMILGVDSKGASTGGGLWGLLSGGKGIGAGTAAGGAFQVGDIGASFAGFFAEGGYVPPGQWGIAGERGPEPIYGGKTGLTVQPTGGGQPIVVNQYFTVGDVATMSDVRRAVQGSEARIGGAIARSQRFGGAMA